MMKKTYQTEAWKARKYLHLAGIRESGLGDYTPENPRKHSCASRDELDILLEVSETASPAGTTHDQKPFGYPKGYVSSATGNIRTTTSPINSRVLYPTGK